MWQAAADDCCAERQDGMLCMTSHRLVWMMSPGRQQPACGLGLSCVAEVCPAPKQQLFGSRTPRLRLRVFTDAQGTVTGACTLRHDAAVARDGALPASRAAWATPQDRLVSQRRLYSSRFGVRLSWRAASACDARRATDAAPAGARRPRSCCSSCRRRLRGAPGRWSSRPPRWPRALQRCLAPCQPTPCLPRLPPSAPRTPASQASCAARRRRNGSWGSAWTKPSLTCRR